MWLEISAGGLDVVVSRAPQLKNDHDDRDKTDRDTGARGAGK